jgi:hypothetical protein
VKRLLTGRHTVADDYISFELTVNCRNTQAIHSEVMKFYGGQIVPTVRGPAGRAVELTATDDPAATVAGVIERPCGSEEVLPQDVVVLSSHGWENSQVAAGLDGKYELSTERGKRGTTFSSRRSARSRAWNRPWWFSANLRISTRPLVSSSCMSAYRVPVATA